MKEKFGIITKLTYVNLGAEWPVSLGFSTLIFTRNPIGKLEHILREIKIIVPRDPPLITKPLNNMLDKKNRLSKMVINRRINSGLNTFEKNVDAVENAKLNYLANMGNK